jgi:phospholipase C
VSEAFLPQVKNIVFLMLENRSLDNLLGWLYEKDPPPPQNFFPSSSPKTYDGLVAGKYSNPDSSGNPVDVIPIPDNVWNHGQGNAVPSTDPYESLRAYKVDVRAPARSWYGVMNQFFGNQQVIPGLPSPSDGVPAMKGFVQDYASYWDMSRMTSYGPTRRRRPG